MGRNLSETGLEKGKDTLSKWIVVAIVVGIVVAVFCIALYVSYFAVNPFVSSPIPDIILLDGHDGFQGIDYVVYIDVGVKNNGGEGWVTVYAELDSAGRYEEKSSRIFLASGETKQLQFVYDVGFWNTVFSSMTYKARAVVE